MGDEKWRRAGIVNTFRAITAMSSCDVLRFLRFSKPAIVAVAAAEQSLGYVPRYLGEAQYA
jgi:hypothetical protein